MTDGTMLDLPELYNRADQAAIRGQRQSLSSTKWSLWCGVVAAVGGGVSVRFGGSVLDWAAIGSAAAFVAMMLIGLWVLQVKPATTWYDGRAAAESIKTLSWQYAVGGGNFEVGRQRAEDAFVDALVRIRQQLPAVTSMLSGGSQITDTMHALRAEPLDRRRASYDAGRLNDQLRWYHSRAALHDRRAQLWRLLSLALQGLGVIGAMLKATGVVDVDLLGIMAAAAASAAAWLETRDHATLAAAYALTADDLLIVRERFLQLPAELTEQRWSRFVDDAEKAISREHTIWLARRGVTPRS